VQAVFGPPIGVVALIDPVVEDEADDPAWREVVRIISGYVFEQKKRNQMEDLPPRAPITPAKRMDDASIVSKLYGGLWRKLSIVVVIPAQKYISKNEERGE
jgi:hypothetical protein